MQTASVTLPGAVKKPLKKRAPSCVSCPRFEPPDRAARLPLIPRHLRSNAPHSLACPGRERQRQAPRCFKRAQCPRPAPPKRRGVQSRLSSATRWRSPRSIATGAPASRTRLIPGTSFGAKAADPRAARSPGPREAGGGAYLVCRDITVLGLVRSNKGTEGFDAAIVFGLRAERFVHPPLTLSRSPRATAASAAASRSASTEADNRTFIHSS
jgi:hypothetical protein